MGVSHGPGLVIGGGCAIGEGMIGAPDSAIPFKLVNSANIAAGAATATTNRLTLPSGKTFQAGKQSDDTNPLPSIDPAADVFIEVEFMVSPVAAVNGQAYEFFIYDNDNPLDTITVTPVWTYGVLTGFDVRSTYFINLV